MRFAIYSLEGVSLSWQRRLHDEGHQVLVYIDKKHGDNQQHIGDGLVPKTGSLDEWLRFGAVPDTIHLFDCTDGGPLADRLRRAGRLVIGGGTFCDRLENDRPFGEEIAASHEILAPPSNRFSTISAALSWLHRNPQQKVGDGGWAWKPNRNLGCDATWVDTDTEGMTSWLQDVARPRFGDNITCLLQERIPGVALSTARWWNGMSWVGPYEGTIEEKKLMDGDKGPSTGCALNLVWFYHDNTPDIASALAWEALAHTWRKYDAPPGLYDINAIVNRHGAWFLEWTPRLGIDSELTSQRGITDLGAFLAALVKGQSVDEFFDANRVYVGVRLTIPPYPNDGKLFVPGKSPATDVPVWGADGLWQRVFVAVGVARNPSGIVVADPEGFIGCAVSAGSSLADACSGVYDYLDNQLVIANLQYRTDAEKNIQTDIDKLHGLGWETTPMLDESEEEYAGT